MLTRITAIFALVLLLVIAPSAAQDATETPVPTDIPTPIPTETPTATASPTAIETPTETATLSATPTLIETATADTSATTTSEPFETVSPSPTLIESPSPTVTLSPSPSLTATASITPTLTLTPNQQGSPRVPAPGFHTLAGPAVIYLSVTNVTELINAVDAANDDFTNIYVIWLDQGEYTFTSQTLSPLTSFYASYMPVYGQVVLVGQDAYNAGKRADELPPAQQAIITRAPNSTQMDFIHILNGGSVTLYNLVVEDGGGEERFAGGGFVNDGSLTIYNSLIKNHSASNSGGAIFNGQTGWLVAANTIFTNNSTISDGGAIHNDPNGGFYLNCIYFDDNDSGGGGAIYIDEYNSLLSEIHKSNFENNSANTGGAIVIHPLQNGLLFAQNNWWNSTSGPSFGTNIDDSISDDVNIIYEPYEPGFRSLGCAVPPVPVQSSEEATATPTDDFPATATAYVITATAQAGLTLTAQAQATPVQLQGQPCGAANEPWWRLQRFNQNNNNRPQFPRSQHPNFPFDPEDAEDAVGLVTPHHGVNGSWMAAIFGSGYNYNTAWTVLMPRNIHTTLNHWWGNAGWQLDKRWLDLYQDALDDFVKSNTPEDCEKDYWDLFKEEAKNAVCEMLHRFFVAGVQTVSKQFLRGLEVFDWLAGYAEYSDPCDDVNLNDYARSLPRVVS